MRTVENVHQVPVKGMLIREHGKALDDLAELLAACFLRKPAEVSLCRR